MDENYGRYWRWNDWIEFLIWLIFDRHRMVGYFLEIQGME
jgi:hypothetical protein